MNNKQTNRSHQATSTAIAYPRFLPISKATIKARITQQVLTKMNWSEYKRKNTKMK